MTDEASFDYAIDLHRHGRLPKAAQIYREVLQSEPNHPGALHLLGVICHQRGDHDAAIALIGRGQFRYYERVGVSKKSTLGSCQKPKFTHPFQETPECYTLVSTNTSDS